MSALVIDTSSWIPYFADGEGDTVIEPALADGRVHLPPLVAAELLSGRLTKRARERLEDLLRSLPLCPGGIDHWFRVGRLRGALAGKGVTVSTPDAHVAQCALDLDADLLSRDAIFELVACHNKLRVLPG